MDTQELYRIAKEKEKAAEIANEESRQAFESFRHAQLKKITEDMTTHNLTIEELAAFMKVPLVIAPRSGVLRTPKPLKYFNPSNPNQKWSGVGSTPLWAKPFEITGSSPRRFRDEISIKAQPEKVTT